MPFCLPESVLLCFRFAGPPPLAKREERMAVCVLSQDLGVVVMVRVYDRGN